MISTTSLLLSWELPVPEHQNGIILQYHVNIRTLNTNSSENMVARNTSITLSDLHPFYTYEMMVAAESSVGVGPYSQIASRSMPETSRSLMIGKCSNIRSYHAGV